MFTQLNNAFASLLTEMETQFLTWWSLIQPCMSSGAEMLPSDVFPMTH